VRPKQNPHGNKEFEMSETMYVERLRMKENQWVWMVEVEQFDLEADFGIDEENLSQEICRMGLLLVRYATIAGEVSANLARKEEAASLVKAQLSGAFRSQAETDGKKITVDAIKDKVISDPLYQKALSELHILRGDAVKIDHWYRSCVKKADLLNALAFRQNSEIKRAY
jgi:hypothetical protein